MKKDYKFPYNYLQYQQDPNIIRGNYPSAKQPNDLENLFFCADCSDVWEKIPFEMRAKRNDPYTYYSDFPSIGKPRKICPRCKCL